jgi:hypothetical protein
MATNSASSMALRTAGSTDEKFSDVTSMARWGGERSWQRRAATGATARREGTRERMERKREDSEKEEDIQLKGREV